MSFVKFVAGSFPYRHHISDYAGFLKKFRQCIGDTGALDAAIKSLILEDKIHEVTIVLLSIIYQGQGHTCISRLMAKRSEDYDGPSTSQICGMLEFADSLGTNALWAEMGFSFVVDALVNDNVDEAREYIQAAFDNNPERILQELCSLQSKICPPYERETDNDLLRSFNDLVMVIACRPVARADT